MWCPYTRFLLSYAADILQGVRVYAVNTGFLAIKMAVDRGAPDNSAMVHKKLSETAELYSALVFFFGINP